jgi:Anti-sigma-28 factor, FlgM
VTTPSSDRPAVTILSHMTALALRYDTRPGRFRSGDRGGTGFVRDARAARDTIPMDESRTIKMRALQAQLERDEYEIDPEKIAAAIVERLLAAASARTPAK